MSFAGETLITYQDPTMRTYIHREIIFKQGWETIPIRGPIKQEAYWDEGKLLYVRFRATFDLVQEMQVVWNNIKKTGFIRYDGKAIEFLYIKQPTFNGINIFVEEAYTETGSKAVYVEDKANNLVEATLVYSKRDTNQAPMVLVSEQTKFCLTEPPKVWEEIAQCRISPLE